MKRASSALVATASAWLLLACAAPPPTAPVGTRSGNELSDCVEMLQGGFRTVASQRDEGFNGKVAEQVARCRGGDKAVALRKTP